MSDKDAPFASVENLCVVFRKWIVAAVLLNNVYCWIFRSKQRLQRDILTDFDSYSPDGTSHARCEAPLKYA